MHFRHLETVKKMNQCRLKPLIWEKKFRDRFFRLWCSLSNLNVITTTILPMRCSAIMIHSHLTSNNMHSMNYNAKFRPAAQKVFLAPCYMCMLFDRKEISQKILLYFIGIDGV